MPKQIANHPTTPINTTPEWSKGLSTDQINAIRREAIRLGKPPTELIREWILALSEKLSSNNTNPSLRA